MSAPPLPTEYVNTLGTYTPSQWGTYDYGTTTWDDSAVILTGYENNVPPGTDRRDIGLQFQLYTLNTDSGLPVNPVLFPEPRPYDFVTDTAAESGTFSLSLRTINLIAVNDGTLSVYLVPEVDPAVFTTASPPFSRGEGADTLLAQIDHRPPPTFAELEFALSFAVLKPYIQHPNFRGKLAFSIDWTASIGGGIFMASPGVLIPGPFAPTITARQTPFHTGMMVSESELQRKSRAVHSYKSGFPYLSDEAAPDGFTDGIMMHPDDYDPIDPVAQGHGDYVPAPNESVVDDEVTDLEG